MWIIVPSGFKDFEPDVSPRYALGNLTSLHGIMFASEDCSFIAIYRTREEARDALRNSALSKTHSVQRVYVEVGDLA